MKVIDKSGEAELRKSALEAAADRSPWGDGWKITKELAERQLAEAEDQFATEIVAWIMETDVDFDRASEDDLFFSVHSHFDTLYTVGIMDILTSWLDVLDHEDAEERGHELSSREDMRQRVAKALRAMADGVEIYQPKE